MTPRVGLVTQQYQTTTCDILIYKASTSSDPLRLRSGTGTNFRILGKYKMGTEVVVLNRDNSSWFEVICPDGKHGYMSSQYLTYMDTLLGYRLEVKASTVFLTENVRSATLTAHVWHGNSEVTDTIEAARFRWYRESDDAVADAV